MPESKEFQLKAETFKKLQSKAEKILEKISGIGTGSSLSKLGCFSFFHTLASDEGSLVNVKTIIRVAQALDNRYNAFLAAYLQEAKNETHILITSEMVMDFKIHSLVGCYLLQLYRLDARVEHNKLLIDIIRRDLLDDFDAEHYDVYLTAFGDFCAFIFKNQSNKLYTDLNRQVNSKPIQLEIHNARSFKTTAVSLLSDTSVSGVHELLGKSLTI